jgi:pyruvate-formate lyase-activating enzyme
MYVNRGGDIAEQLPDSYLVEYPISIETTPFIHFYPQEKFLQVSTIGCNLTCPGCVSELLTRTVQEFAPSLIRKTPETIVQRAKAEGCRGIVFALNEPAVSYPSFIRLATAARDSGLLVGCATNGYFTKSALQSLIPFLDAAAVGIKGPSEHAYRQCGARAAEPVFRNLGILHEMGIHVEATVVHERGAEEDVISTCRRVADLSPEIPVQVMRFIAFGPSNLSLEPGIRESERLCDRIREYSQYVYLFNSPGSSYLNTCCPRCGTPVVIRELHGPMGARVVHQQQNWVCQCGYHLPFTGSCAAVSYQEEGMMGGYRPTRALEVIKAITACLGIDDEQTSARVWVDFVSRNYIDTLHKKIQGIETYYEIITHLAHLTGREEEADALIGYLRDKTSEIFGMVEGLSRPKVLYVMGLPLFALNEDRFENNLVKRAGGEPVNKNFPRKGKPGIMITPEQLKRLDPEVIMISGFLSSPVEDSYAVCEEQAIDIRAVREKRIYTMPPSWDFGSPRWILGLAYLARTLHPDEVKIDPYREADIFYQRFYHMPFSDAKPNRSFFRPSAES